MVIENMASQGKEPTFCMGDDIPLAVLSQKSHMLYDYFKQRFAQVDFLASVISGLCVSLENTLFLKIVLVNSWIDFKLNKVH